MKVYKNPPEETWPSLVRRPQLELGLLDDSVRGILARVRKDGDKALREFTLQFDKAEVGDLQVAASEIAQAERVLTPELTMAIRQAAENIRKFHAAQRRDTLIVETMPGVKCWRKPVPIGRVGIYIPGGSAPLFSTVLMLGIPAQLAGCTE
ncbi:MAG TPA: histidinol dehydrogenase, partial [Chryseosolibacter sp.]|nr:histidinol dehydrogenase [Chryseosolibacter sp.]